MGEAEDVNLIKNDIEETRASLNRKIDALETGVRHTVDETRALAAGTVEEARQKVRRTFSLKHHVRQRPWHALGLSVGAGLTLGLLLRRMSDEHELGAAGQPAPAPAGHPLLSMFRDELELVKTTAIGVLMGVARDLAKDLLPDTVGDKVDELANGMTTKLGGEPLKGRVVNTP